MTKAKWGQWRGGDGLGAARRSTRLEPGSGLESEGAGLVLQAAERC